MPIYELCELARTLVCGEIELIPQKIFLPCIILPSSVARLMYCVSSQCPGRVDVEVNYFLFDVVYHL